MAFDEMTNWQKVVDQFHLTKWPDDKIIAVHWHLTKW